MPALNFNSEFAPSIRAGRKLSTIRRWRQKRPFRSGDRLSLYTGLNGFRKAHLLMRVRCWRTAPVYIDRHLAVLDGEKQDEAGMEAIARCEGFQNWPSFLKNFEELYELPFEGQMIFW